ncbi:MAG: hypothetical protein KME45_31670 [Stenomitos rutilans HA7619-LM2]|nr:hypothetical protein [Stenomitos rutilans HA7619-LM2]
MSESPKGFSRRQILATGGLGGLGALSAAALTSSDQPAVAQQPTQPATPRGGSLPPQIQLPPISAQTEVETGGPSTALPTERRLGFAIDRSRALDPGRNHACVCRLQTGKADCPSQRRQR